MGSNFLSNKKRDDQGGIVRHRASFLVSTSKYEEKTKIVLLRKRFYIRNSGLMCFSATRRRIQYADFLEHISSSVLLSASYFEMAKNCFRNIVRFAKCYEYGRTVPSRQGYTYEPKCDEASDWITCFLLAGSTPVKSKCMTFNGSL